MTAFRRYLLIATLALSTADAQVSGKLDWWQTTVIYQVYPRSFKDFDNDGVGDIKGIEHNAGHLKKLGVDAVWLSPIFKSPMVDFGYDISNFICIDNLFGTLDDFKALVRKLKFLGVRILLDFVPNHSSDKHEWFEKSVQKIDPYTDYYVWLDGKIDSNGSRIPPNNWRSEFGNSAWEWSPEREQYYLHQFTKQQPDLNYHNPAVLEEMQNVLRYWLDLGVDGFRVDAVPHLVEDPRYLDEPLINPAEPDDGISNNLLDHIYVKNQMGTYKIIEEFRKVLDEYTIKNNCTRVLLVETYTTINYTMMYYSTETPRAHMPFNFNLITQLNITSSAIDIKNAIMFWMDNMPKNHWPNWVVGNHDQKRVATRFGSEMVDPMNTLVMLLPGTAITYNGEEIGMSDFHIRWDQTVDPLGLARGEEEYELVSRDPARTPFQWNDDKNAGFSTANHTWLPVNSNYWYLNLANQTRSFRSHYRTYQRLVYLRKSPTVKRGDLTIYTPSKWVLIFTRKLRGFETFLIILNVGTEQEIIPLKDIVPGVPPFAIIRCSSMNAWQSEGDLIALTYSVTMRPKSSLVLSYISIL